MKLSRNILFFQLHAIKLISSVILCDLVLYLTNLKKKKIYHSQAYKLNGEDMKI